MTLIDIGANLTHDSFDTDRDAVLQRAHDAGVAQLVVTGASREHSPKALAARARRDRACCSPPPACIRTTRSNTPTNATPRCAGCSPTTRSSRSANAGWTTSAISRRARRSGVRSSASCRSPPTSKAAGKPKPLFLHQREAHDDFVADHARVSTASLVRRGRALLHRHAARSCSTCLDRDWHVGITGWLCDERRGGHLRELVPHIPADRLMIETDAPYLLPRTVKPQPANRRNEPMYLAHIVEELARDRGEAVAATAAAATATTRSFFCLPALPAATC